MKEWRDISGYENKYRVSTDGEVLSLNYKNRFSGPKLMSGQITRKGYLRVILSLNRVPKLLSVHRLVAIAFIPNPENLPQVNHKDGNKLNNSVENLEWISNENNIKHAHENNLRANSYRKGELHPGARLTEDDVRQIRSTPGTHKSVGEKFGIDFTTVSKIKLRKLWPHIL